jgi:hypothetical protein
MLPDATHMDVQICCRHWIIHGQRPEPRLNSRLLLLVVQVSCQRSKDACKRQPAVRAETAKADVTLHAGTHAAPSGHG